MHLPSAGALRALDRYCIILVHTLKHLLPAKCVINITYTLISDIVTCFSKLLTAYNQTLHSSDEGRTKSSQLPA